MRPEFLAVVYAAGDVAVVQVNPLALLRYRGDVPAGAAWQSTRDDTWTAYRPDRNWGLVYRLASRRLAELFLAAEVAE